MLERKWHRAARTKRGNDKKKVHENEIMSRVTVFSYIIE